MKKPVTVLYFAWLRERTGLAQEEFQLPDSSQTVSSLVDFLSARSVRHAAAFQHCEAVRCAVNQEFADLSCPVQPGDEIAFFPPVTGG